MHNEGCNDLTLVLNFDFNPWSSGVFIAGSQGNQEITRDGRLEKAALGCRQNHIGVVNRQHRGMVSQAENKAAMHKILVVNHHVIGGL